jgi:hypothetical protein
MGVLRTASDVFPFVFACLLAIFRRPFASHTVKLYNRFYGLEWGRRAERIWEYLIIAFGVAFFLMGLLYSLQV